MSQTIIAPAPNGIAATGYLTRRCLAFLIDMTIAAILGWTLFLVILLFGILTFGLGLIMLHVLPWVPFIYLTLFIGGTGATPGQRLCGIAVRAEHTMRPPSLAQALAFSLLLGLSLALCGLPLLLALFNPRRQAPHDILSGLTITRRPRIAY